MKIKSPAEIAAEQIKAELRRYFGSHNWAWKPDPVTVNMLSSGRSKTKRYELPPKRIEEMKMEQAKAAADKAANPKKSKTVKKVVKKVVTKSDAPAKAKPVGDLIPLKVICQELKIDPRLARRKLRKSGVSGHDNNDRWTFKKDSTLLAKVREVLAA